MCKQKTRKFVSLLLVFLMTFGSMQAIAWVSEPYDTLLPPTHEVSIGDMWEWGAESFVKAPQPERDNEFDYAYSILTSTLNGSVGMQGFEGMYAISCPNEIVEIIVQFVTPPTVALRLMDESAISPQRIGRALQGASFEEQALSAHDVFSQQLNSIPVSFSAGRSTMEIFSEHHTLFNGVFMRVPGYMVGMIASLPEVFAVTPSVTFYTMYELEQRQLAYYLESSMGQGLYYLCDELEQYLYCQCNEEDVITLNDAYYAATLTTAETLGNSSFVYYNFMRTVREYFDLDYIHNVRGITGAGVRVAVIDTGIYHAHPEFAGFLDETGRIRGWERRCNAPSDEDDHRTRRHGTTVSGAVIGVAPGVELWHYRISLNNIGDGLNPIEAIEAAYSDGIDIVNMSFGVGARTPFEPINATVNTAVLGGMIMVPAAGNSGFVSDFTILSPGNASLAITVGASYTGGVWANRGDIRVNYSALGPSSLVYHIKPDVLAPTKLITTYIYGEYSPDNDPSEGTSHAAPIIAGIAALLLEAFPDATPIEIKARIMNTARPLTGTQSQPNSVFAVGAGFVQPLQALTTQTMVTVQNVVPMTEDSFWPETMASLSFGLLNLHYDESMNRTMLASIKNAGDTTVTYTISHMFTRNNYNAASISLSNTHVTVAPNSTRQFNVTMSIRGNSMFARFPEFYEGYIYVRNGATVVARLPFGAVVKNEPTSEPMAKLFRVYTEQQFREVLSQRHFTQMIIDVAADFNMEQSFALHNIHIPANSNVAIRGADGYNRTIGTTLNQHSFIVDGNLTLQNIRIVSEGQRNVNGFVVNSGGHLTVLNGTAINGNLRAGVEVRHGGNLTMYGGEISGNMFRGVLISNAGTFNMHGGEISSNTVAGNSGGGVFSNGIFNMYNGRISGNIAGDHGGGVVISNGTFNMYGGEISGNTAGSNGGGVLTMGNNSAFNMHGGKISGNSATNGGGISVTTTDINNGRLHIGRYSVFSNNTASNAFHRLPSDDALYNQFIHATRWTQPFTQGFNNFDIQYTSGTRLQMQRLIFHLNSTPANPTNPLQITSLYALPGAQIMRTFRFPTDPTRQGGYFFAGWYLDSNFTQQLTQETIMPSTDTNIYARWRTPYVIFHFDNTEVWLPVINGYIDISQVPVPATRYGRPGQPGWAHMGWFAELFDGMHWFGLGANRAIAFNYRQHITQDMTDEYGHLHLHASFLRYGDLNGDGIIDPTDRSIMQNLLLGVADNVHRVTADVNVDGIICPVDRSLLQFHLLGAPGVVLGVPGPSITLGSYLISFHFGSQTIDVPIANGGIDTTLISEAELLIWEIELMNFLYSAYQRGGRSAGLFVYVNELHSANSYVLELDTSAFKLNISTLELELYEIGIRR